MLTLIFLVALFFAAQFLPVFALTNDPAQISDIVDIIANIISLLAPTAAIAVFIMIVVAGFQFLTSGGDPKAVAAARTTLTYAILGAILVVVVFLVLLLISSVTGLPLLTVHLN